MVLDDLDKIAPAEGEEGAGAYNAQAARIAERLEDLLADGKRCSPSSFGFSWSFFPGVFFLFFFCGVFFPVYFPEFFFSEFSRNFPEVFPRVIPPGWSSLGFQSRYLRNREGTMDSNKHSISKRCVVSLPSLLCARCWWMHLRIRGQFHSVWSRLFCWPEIRAVSCV